MSWVGVARLETRLVGMVVWGDDRHPEQRHTGLVDLDAGSMVFALRDRVPGATDPICRVAEIAVHGDEMAVAVEYFRFDTAGETLEASWGRFYRGASPLVASASATTTIDPLGLGPIQALALADEMLAAETGGAVAWAVGDGAPSPVSRSLFPNGVQNVRAVGTRAFWEDWGTTTRLVSADADGDVRIERAVVDGTLRGFSSDDSTFAWLEASAFDGATSRFARVELWTAAAEGALAPRMVRVVSDVAPGVVGGGLYSLAEGSGAEAHYAIYRLADGARAEFHPSGSPAEHVLHVSATDIVFDAWTSIYRIDPTTLTFE